MFENETKIFLIISPNESGQVIPKPGHEIDAILKDFAKTTCQQIRRKRKKSIPKEDIFITVVHPLDRYSCGSVNFQAYANSLPRDDTVVVCHSEFYGADNLAKEHKRIYTNVNSQLDNKELNYLNGLFS